MFETHANQIAGKYRELQRLTGQYARLLDLDLGSGAGADADSMEIEN